jgi:hypothetical protein
VILARPLKVGSLRQPIEFSVAERRNEQTAEIIKHASYVADATQSNTHLRKKDDLVSDTLSPSTFLPALDSTKQAWYEDELIEVMFDSFSRTGI